MTTIDDETRQRVREQYPDTLNADPVAAGKKVRGRTTADSARAGKNAQQGGAQFEAELNDTHDGFARDGTGYIMPHYPPVFGIPGKMAPRAGGGPCDYSGHVNMICADRSVDWKLVRDTDAKLPRFARLPVVFDAKKIGVGHHSYTHPARKVAQIHHLKNAHQSGARAFLLVRADEVQRVFMIGYENHEIDLMRMRPITLFESKAATFTDHRLGASVERSVRECFPLLPSISYTPGKGWLWPSLLAWL